MWRPLIAGTAVLALAGTSLVYAQSDAARDGRGGDRDRSSADGTRRGPSPEDMRAFGEARLAGLKAGLQLTPDQERNWAPFEQAARDLAKVRMDQFTAARALRRDDASRTTDPIERLRKRADSMSTMGGALKKFTDAADPLYKSLDEAQKRRFSILAPMGFRGEGRDGRSHGMSPRGRERGMFRGGPDGGGPRGADRDSRRSEMAPTENTPLDRFQRGPRYEDGSFESGPASGLPLNTPDGTGERL